jgi:UDP-N-acetylmuramoyl-L-alanyl-D-glutamate--2,6-diaminopimelate ligase
MRLSALTRGLPLRPGAGDPEITLVTEDSRRVRPGAVFVAISGTSQDGHAFVRDALHLGAAAVVVERADAVPPTAVAHAIVPSTRSVLARLAARFHGEPGASLRLIGFTGTFGKTTTSNVLRALLDAAGMKPAVVGSLGVRFGDFHDPGNGLTTPAPPQLHEWLAAVRRLGADAAIMEVTSHALQLGRVDGLTFGGGLIAAIMPGEHTDFHRTYRDYVAAKRLFLSYLDPAAVLAFDLDNRASRQLGSEAPVAIRAGVALERRDEATLAVEAVALDDRGAMFTVRGEHVNGSQRVRSALLGRPNVRNVALALAYSLASGLPLDKARPVLDRLQPLRRRMERFDAAGRIVLDDTAGHPDSLHAVFEVVRMIRRDRLWVVWAIRGSRGMDLNAANASTLADLVDEHGAEDLVISSADGEVEPKDAVVDSEVDAVRRTLDARGRSYTFQETLDGAMRQVASRSRAGDLIVLVGAQGMNEGKRLLQEVLLDEQRPG